MTAEEIIEIGERLFGRNWQTAMARELGVNPRTVRRWKRVGVKGRFTVDAVRRMVMEKSDD